MALRIKVPCSGEEHELLISSYDGDGEHLEVGFADHDPEYDIAYAAMGGRMPACYNFEPLFSKGMSYVFLDETMIPAFIKALQEQGVEALGISQDEFVDQVVDFLDWRMSTYNSDLISVDSFLEMVADKLSWMKDNEAFQSGLHRLANIAYRHSEWEVFVSLVKFAKKPLIRIEGTRNETKDEDGPGHSIRNADIKVFVNDEKVDYWDIVLNGWFCDYGPMEWCVERDKNLCSHAYSTTEDFLNVICIDVKEFEMQYAPEAPEIPKYDYDSGFGYRGYHHEAGRNWALLHNDYIWGYFKNEDDAWRVFDMMRDSHDFIGVGVGVYMRLMHYTGKVPEDCDEEDCDVNNPNNWEVLAGEDI